MFWQVSFTVQAMKVTAASAPARQKNCTTTCVSAMPSQEHMEFSVLAHIGCV